MHVREPIPFWSSIRFFHWEIKDGIFLKTRQISLYWLTCFQTQWNPGRRWNARHSSDSAMIYKASYFVHWTPNRKKSKRIDYISFSAGIYRPHHTHTPNPYVYVLLSKNALMDGFPGRGENSYVPANSAISWLHEFSWLQDSSFIFWLKIPLFVQVNGSRGVSKSRNKDFSTVREPEPALLRQSPPVPKSEPAVLRFQITINV